AEALSRRYRAEVRDGRFHLDGDLAALAYLATRLPATYAAITASLSAAAEMRPDFAPRTMMDAGAGPGSALWAAAGVWPSVAEALLIEGSGAIRSWGRKLAARAPVARIDWMDSDLGGGAADSWDRAAPRDLVTCAYVLGELAPAAGAALVDRLWSLTADMLVIVEPGTPAGWSRILAARDRLIAAGAYLLAPCPHARACPLQPPDWCHFARRVARSRLHRQAKYAEVPWEDEKFIYLATSRRPGAKASARVIAPPRAGSGRITLKLCQPDATMAERQFTRRDGAAYKAAQRLAWGDQTPAQAPASD
ncbi:MAG TPA: small ribosomal subunit Rsm22 family protein, partial [Dongiaceae bacterium]